MSSLSIRAWVTETGGDPAKVRFVETPMSTMLPMVQDRHVDAMFVSEPGTSGRACQRRDPPARRHLYDDRETLLHLGCGSR